MKRNAKALAVLAALALMLGGITASLAMEGGARDGGGAGVPAGGGGAVGGPGDGSGPGAPGGPSGGSDHDPDRNRAGKAEATEDFCDGVMQEGEDSAGSEASEGADDAYGAEDESEYRESANGAQ
jgi:hypothetical protein